ncbi:MAG TPA: tetratricopeptide repeat protein [Planctomycetota bacterium]
MIGLSAALVLAHGSLDEQLAMMDRLVEASPDHPRHRLRRGELRRAHAEEHRGDPAAFRKDVEAAELDFARALELAPGFHDVLLARGRLRLEAGRAADARADLDVFCREVPEHPGGHLFRGRALARLARRAEAAEAFTRAIALSPSPGPEIFLERATVAANPEEALAGLEEGRRRLGDLVTLDLAALDVEVELGRLDDALARCARWVERPGRCEEWQWRRAQLLRKSGCPAEARAACEAGLASLETLPPSRRGTPAVRDLEARLRGELAANR